MYRRSVRFGLVRSVRETRVDSTGRVFGARIVYRVRFSLMKALSCDDRERSKLVSIVE